MSHLDPVRRTSSGELRSFGLLVGGAFIALAAIVVWRSGAPRSTTAIGLAAAGGALVMAGLVAPRLLAAVHAGWMRLALLLSRVTTPIFMGAIYFLVLTPLGLVMRALGRDPMRVRPGASLWITRPVDGRASALERQF